MIKFLTKLNVVLILLAIATALTPRVRAQTVGVSINPPVAEMLLAPNHRGVQTFMIKNQGKDVSLTPSLHTVTPNGTNGHALVDPNPLSPASIPLVASLGPISFNETFLLKQNDSLALTLTLEGSSVDLVQDIYLALMIKVNPDLITNSSISTTASPAISALILTTLAPSAIIPANLEIVAFDPPLIHDSGNPLIIHPMLQNNANIMIRPLGKYEIMNPQGNPIYSVDIYNNLLLKESRRIIEGSDMTDPRVPTQLVWTPTWKNIGPYRLRITINTQGGTQLTQVEKTVWILPIKAIITILLLAFIMYLLLRYQKKSSQY